ncbi:hypothetical protein SAMN05216428_105217 [Nitrosospira sp. Nsp11]|nr:hypothetical protein SAMN05216428_105217 [Nitrosospira sp. Nsp11]
MRRQSDGLFKFSIPYQHRYRASSITVSLLVGGRRGNMFFLNVAGNAGHGNYCTACIVISIK